MGKKKKISPSVKIKQVELYLEGKTSLHQIARKYGVAHSTVEIWVVKYKAEGRSGFYQEKRFKAYSKELKEQAVLEYLRGGVSLKTVCTKYAISSTTALRNWIKEYNAHGKLKSNSGGSRMSKTRKTTQEERLEIVKYCILNGKDYVY